MAKQPKTKNTTNNTSNNEEKRTSLKPRKITSKKMTEEELAKVDIEVQGLAQVSSAVKESVVNINSGRELRTLVDSYYQAQDSRIETDNQIRSIVQEYDTSQDGKAPSALQWLAENRRNEEKQVQKMLDYYTNSSAIGRWLKANIGIGPTLAAGLIAYFDISKTKHVNQFHSYAGLNDNNVPWLGRDKAKKIVIQALENCSMDPAKVKGVTHIKDEVLVQVALLTNRNISSIVRNSKNDEGYISRDSLEKYLALPPYNRKLKVLCYKIGESFVKVSGKDDSLYGKLYKERKLQEMVKNENLEFADQAKKALEEKNYSKGTDAYKYYSEGKLPPAHIQARAKRFATKIFISHLFDAMYIDYYHRIPPTPYPIEFMGHVDIIKPEVPYEDYLDCNNLLPKLETTVDDVVNFNDADVDMDHYEGVNNEEEEEE